MSQKSSAPTAKPPAEKLVRDIRRVTRKHHSAEDKIRIVLEGQRGGEGFAPRPGLWSFYTATRDATEDGRQLDADYVPSRFRSTVRHKPMRAAKLNLCDSPATGC